MGTRSHLAGCSLCPTSHLAMAVKHSSLLYSACVCIFIQATCHFKRRFSLKTYSSLISVPMSEDLTQQRRQELKQMNVGQCSNRGTTVLQKGRLGCVRSHFLSRLEAQIFVRSGKAEACCFAIDLCVL